MHDPILLVDDEPNITAALKRVLIENGYDTYTAQSGAEALNILRKNLIKIIVSDEQMPGMSGADLLCIVKERYPHVVRMMLTGHASLESAMKAVNGGEIYRFFNKPWDNTELLLSMRNAVEKYDLEEENMNLLETIRRYESDLERLEKMHPGITKVDRHPDGALILSMPDEEYDMLMSQYKVKEKIA